MGSVQRALTQPIASNQIEVGGQKWSLESLLAPFAYQLSGEAAIGREALTCSLFPSDDRVRVLSFWFKAADFSLAQQDNVWPE